MYSYVKIRKEELRAALAKLTANDFEACKALLKTTPVAGDEIKRAAAKEFVHKMSFMGMGKSASHREVSATSRTRWTSTCRASTSCTRTCSRRCGSPSI